MQVAPVLAVSRGGSYVTVAMSTRSPRRKSREANRKVTLRGTRVVVRMEKK